MATIDGFDYEPWERSSSLAKRDFQHSHGGPEIPPHRKKKPKKSSKHRPCPDTGGAHVYVWQKDERFSFCNWWTEICAGCGKNGRWDIR